MKYLILLLITFNAIAGLPPTTSKVSGDASDITTFKYQFPNFTGTHTGTTISLGVNSIAGGGTGQATKAAAFDALQPMTTGGDLIYGGASGTGTRLANGTAGQVLTSAGTTLAPSWTTVSPVFAYTAQTTAYSAAIGDFVDCTSGTFAVTLPTAVGNAAKMIKIKNTGTGVITINTTSAQTIDGYASGVIKLATTKDYITVASDGANWKLEEFNVFVGASYYLSANQSLTANTTIINYDTVLYDSYSAVTTGASWKFTAPLTGKYIVSVTSLTTTVSDFILRKNTSNFAFVAGIFGTGGNPGSGTIIISLAAGDTIDVISDTSLTLGGSAAPYRSYISITRTGN